MESNFNKLTQIFGEWITDSNDLEKRATLVSLANPEFLNNGNAEYYFTVADLISIKININEDFKVLKRITTENLKN